MSPAFWRTRLRRDTSRPADVDHMSCPHPSPGLAIRATALIRIAPTFGTTRKDDSALWYGDVVELLLEIELTPSDEQ